MKKKIPDPKQVSFLEFVRGIYKCKTCKEIDEYAKTHEIESL